LTAADRALCQYAETATRTPTALGAGAVELLRRAGFDDRGILDACQVVAYFNLVNRLALGLGVELEAYWTADERDGLG
jgi:alkylhydroperoxidase family enzyme